MSLDRTAIKPEDLFRQKYVATLKRKAARQRIRLTSVSIRVIEFMLAGLLVTILSPVMLARAVLAYARLGYVVHKKAFIGQQGKRGVLLYFGGDHRGSSLLLLVNILKGDLAFVGPSVHSAEVNAERLSIKPGLFSLYDLRKRIRIAHQSELDTDREYIYQQNLKSNIGLMVRFIISYFLGGKTEKSSPQLIDFFNIKVLNKDMQEAVTDIMRFANAEEQTQVAFVNPDCLNIAWNDKQYRSVLNRSGYVLPDGIGIHIGCRLQNVSLKANVNGTDLFPQLCDKLQHTGVKVFLLGARPGVAEKTAVTMRNRFPGLNICGTQHGYFEQHDTQRVINDINASGADILLVAMGAPMQELWIDQHRENINARVLMGVGGLFDFYSGRVSRAPVWVREIGMEWVWRIFQEPQRMWRRYVVGNPLFLYRVWRYGKKQDYNKTTHEDGSSLPGANGIFLRRAIERLLWSKSGWIMRSLKRLLDITVSILMLLMLSPFLLLIAVAIRLESRGPVLFKQRRVGLGGAGFDFWKFRSMYVDAEQRKAELLKNNQMQGGVLFKMKNDPRITRVGRIIRRASIDELPQLWNVLKGDMSLVGPRPCLPSEVMEYSMHDRNRLDVLPGLTCIWQISGRSDIPFEQQIEMDLEYINKASFSEDLRLMFKTIPAVVTGRGAY